MLWFLNENSQPAMFLDLLFMGDRFPDDRRCPRTKAEWRELVEARHLTLGLPKRHPLAMLHWQQPLYVQGLYPAMPQGLAAA